jgi:hypothetical protein
MKNTHLACIRIHRVARIEEAGQQKALKRKMSLKDKRSQISFLEEADIVAIIV